MCFAAEILEDLPIFRRNRHWIMLYISSASPTTRTHGTYGIDRVGLEVVRERSKEQLVEDTSLLNVQIVLNLAVTPVREVLWMVINLTTVNHQDRGRAVDSRPTYCVESVTADQCYGIREDCS